VDFPDLDDALNSGAGDGGSGGRRGKGKKPPKVKVRWSPVHYLGLAVALFALVCILYAVLSEVGVLS
jgi:hypothetical protein